MPVGMQFDITLNGKGYMLARGSLKGRAWKREGQPNAVQPRVTDADLQRNALPAELDFVAVYDDFSGGFGDAYRGTGIGNRIHWAENMEVRFPHQAIHCQQPIDMDFGFNGSPSGGSNAAATDGVNWLVQVPPIDLSNAANQQGLAIRGGMLAYGVDSNFSYLANYVPTGLAGTANAFNRVLEMGGVVGAGPGSANFIATLAGRPALFGSYAWLPASGDILINGGGRTKIWRRDMTGVAGRAATISPIEGQALCVAGNRMWKAAADGLGGHVRYVQSVGIGSDPMGTANWSATLNIGNGQTDILDMVSLNDQVFLSTQDGLYAGDLSGTFFNVFGELATQFAGDSGRRVAVHNNGIAYPFAGGLLYYQQGLDQSAAARDITPSQTSQRSPLRGRFRAVTSYAGWLYGGLYNGSQGYLLAGRDSPNGFIWHPLQRMTGAASIEHIAVDAISAPSGGGVNASHNFILSSRMWVATNGSIATGARSPTYVWPIAPSDGNPLGVGLTGFSANYMGSARMDLGRDDRGAPETRKVLRRVDVNTEASTCLSGSRYADIYYTIDGVGRSLLGRVNDSPRTTLFFPSGEGSFVTCYDFEISAESFTATQAVCPVLRSIVVHGAFLAEGSDVIGAVLDISGNRADRQGTPMRSAAMQITELRGLPGGPPVQLVDLTGAQNWVSVQRSIDEVETYQEGSDEPEVAASVKMAVLKFSP